MDSDQLIAIYTDYLAAFNERSIDKVMSFLTPDCCFEMNGVVMTHSRDEMKANYENHWSKINAPVELLRVVPIEGGLWVKLRSPDDKYDVSVEYWFNGYGLQTKHVIKGVEKWEVPPEDDD